MNLFSTPTRATSFTRPKSCSQKTIPILFIDQVNDALFSILWFARSKLFQWAYEKKWIFTKSLSESVSISTPIKINEILLNERKLISCSSRYFHVIHMSSRWCLWMLTKPRRLCHLCRTFSWLSEYFTILHYKLRSKTTQNNSSNNYVRFVYRFQGRFEAF